MKKIISFIIALTIGFSMATPVLAFPTLVPEECLGEAHISAEGGKCEECDVDQEDRANCCCNLSSVQRLAINISQIILGISGSLALLMFVIGGVMYIASGGDSGKVKKATSILTKAVIGLAIILLSGAIVKYVLLKITGVE